jgi:hypothetical protein
MLKKTRSVWSDKFLIPEIHQKKIWKSGEFRNPQNSSVNSKACSEKDSETTRVVSRYSRITNNS